MPYNGQGQVATCPCGYPFPGEFALEDAQFRKNRLPGHMPTRKIYPNTTQPVRTSRDLSLGLCPPAKYALEACPQSRKLCPRRRTIPNNYPYIIPKNSASLIIFIPNSVAFFNFSGPILSPTIK